MLNVFQPFKQRYSKIIISVGLSLIIFGYILNNLFWGIKSPIYFYRDSIMNIHWAVCYGKTLRNEVSAYHPDLFDILESNHIKRDSNIYYPEEYSKIFKGPIAKKEKITIKDLLKFHHPPLWFTFLGGLFAVFGFQIWIIYFAQTILGAITIWLTYLAAKKILSPTTGLLSAFILSTLPSFLIITRQGFLEAMICPMVLIGIMLVDYILKNPIRLAYYLILGFVCSIGMLIKSTFFIYSISFFIVIIVFVDKKRISYSLFLKNLIFSIVLNIFIALPWYIYAYESFLYYFITSLCKGRAQFLLDPKNILIIFNILNGQLGSILFILLIIEIIYFCFKPRLNVTSLTFFLILGYLLTIFLPLAVRHFSPFLPLATMLICYGITDLSRFKQWIITGLIIFGLIRGYGWFFPNFFQTDQMSYFYDDTGIKEVKHSYSIYVTDINSRLFSSFAPLPDMQQKTVYNTIKEIPTLSGLKLAKIINPDAHILEAKTLAGALSLYSMLESYPLIIEDPNITKYRPFRNRIWIFLRSSGNSIINIKDAELNYITNVPLSYTVSCDIFRED
jgi:hypothetical protein